MIKFSPKLLVNTTSSAAESITKKIILRMPSLVYPLTQSRKRSDECSKDIVNPCVKTEICKKKPKPCPPSEKCKKPIFDCEILADPGCPYKPPKCKKPCVDKPKEKCDDECECE